MRKIALLALALVGCGDFSSSIPVESSGPCVAGYEQRDYYPRDATWCGPVGNDAGLGPLFNPCAQGWRQVGWMGQGVVQCERDGVDAGY